MKVEREKFKMKVFDRKSVCSIRTMCGFVCLWLGLAIMHLPHTIAVIEPTNGKTGVGVPQKRNGNGPNCTNVRTLFESRGINSNEVPVDPINGKWSLFKYFYT